MRTLKEIQLISTIDRIDRDIREKSQTYEIEHTFLTSEIPNYVR